MLKIGLLSPHLPETGGIAIYSANLLNGLGKNRRHVVTIGREGSRADYTLDFKSPSLRNELKKIIKKEKLDVMHIQYVPTLFGKYNLNLNLIHALSLSIPTVITFHEVQYSTAGLRNKIISYIEKEIVKRASNVIVHTPKQKRFLEKKYKTKKIAHIYQGLNLHSTHKKKSKNNILFFGMISSGKGLAYLIKAMKYLPHFNLTIAGRFVDRKIEREIKKELKDSNASNIRADFGWIDESKKEKYYGSSDLVVLPYTWAPYQSAIMQDTVSWNIPVVVTRVGALNEMVEQFKFGEVVKPKSPKSLAEGIKNVFKNYEEYKLGIEDYRKVANWKVVAKKHFELYEELKKGIEK